MKLINYIYSNRDKKRKKERIIIIIITSYRQSILFSRFPSQEKRKGEKKRFSQIWSIIHKRWPLHNNYSNLIKGCYYFFTTYYDCVPYTTDFYFLILIFDYKFFSEYLGWEIIVIIHWCTRINVLIQQENSVVDIGVDWRISSNLELVCSIPGSGDERSYALIQWKRQATSQGRIERNDSGKITQTLSWVREIRTIYLFTQRRLNKWFGSRISWWLPTTPDAWRRP